MKQKAVDAYIGKNGPRVNCAQAVAMAAKEAYHVTDEEIEALGCCGGGHAPGGVCGAIHAVRELLKKRSSVDADTALAEFEKVIGDLHCKVIKGAKKHSCTECVAEAAALAEKFARSRK